LRKRRGEKRNVQPLNELESVAYKLDMVLAKPSLQFALFYSNLIQNLI